MLFLNKFYVDLIKFYLFIKKFVGMINIHAKVDGKHKKRPNQPIRASEEGRP